MEEVGEYICAEAEGQAGVLDARYFRWRGGREKASQGPKRGRSVGGQRKSYSISSQWNHARASEIRRQTAPTKVAQLDMPRNGLPTVNQSGPIRRAYKDAGTQHGADSEGRKRLCSDSLGMP